jgi:LPXTG-motif cell wall-anchored protein
MMMQEGTPTAGAMMQEGTPTAGAMMQEATPTTPAMMPTTGGDSTNLLVPAFVLGLLVVGGGLTIRRFTRHA